jgi:DNA-directed RNA polymerase beta' subunit
MLGKRVNNIGRAVAACDTSNAPDEATLPIEFVQSIHIKESLNDFNRERLMKAFTNGPNVYPGADFVQKPDGRKYAVSDNITFEKGDVLYRHLQAGDRVIVNR